MSSHPCRPSHDALDTCPDVSWRLSWQVGGSPTSQGCPGFDDVSVSFVRLYFPRWQWIKLNQISVRLNSIYHVQIKKYLHMIQNIISSGNQILWTFYWNKFHIFKCQYNTHHVLCAQKKSNSKNDISICWEYHQVHWKHFSLRSSVHFKNHEFWGFIFMLTDFSNSLWF